MTAIVAAAATQHLLSGNEAVARGVWEAGVAIGAAYPGTPSTEILENLARYPDVHAEWSVNEKVSLEVAIGASVVGARGFCAMKHVGMNVASDALMSQTLAGVGGGLVIAIADDVGLSSSQNEQDSRFWGRFGHLPIFEPADSQEAYDMVKQAFDVSEAFCVPVLVRLTTRVCHVKTLVTVGERVEHPAKGFNADPSQWVLVPSTARQRLPLQLARDEKLAAFAETTELNRLEPGADKDNRIGFVTSGPAYMHLREAFPQAPVFKLGFSYPLPLERLKTFAASVEHLLVVEETEPLIENELRAAGVTVHGKDVLPRIHELTPSLITKAAQALLGETAKSAQPTASPGEVFPRPPTMCVGCPHLPVYYCLSRLHRRILISGYIGCYTLGAGHPWNALDPTTCMGATVTMAHGMDLAKGLGPDKDKAVVAVIGDSTFLHMGMPGLANATYNRSNLTLLLLDNRATGMTGGQDHAGTGYDINKQAAPRVDFVKLCQALGVREERIRVLNPYELPTLYGAIKEEIAVPEVSVIITNQDCVLIEDFHRHQPLKVVDEACTGCSNCLNVGCPAIQVTRRETETRANGKQVEKSWVTIETSACTGCNFCPQTCGPKAIVPAQVEKLP